MFLVWHRDDESNHHQYSYIVELPEQGEISGAGKTGHTVNRHTDV